MTKQTKQDEKKDTRSNSPKRANVLNKELRHDFCDTGKQLTEPATKLVLALGKGD